MLFLKLNFDVLPNLHYLVYIIIICPIGDIMFVVMSVSMGKALSLNCFTPPGVQMGTLLDSAGMCDWKALNAPRQPGSRMLRNAYLGPITSG